MNYEFNEKIKNGVYIKNRVVINDLLLNKIIMLSFIKNEKFIVLKYLNFYFRVYFIDVLIDCK